MLFDLGARVAVRSRVHAALPHLDRAVLETRLLVEHREVLQGGEMLRIELDRFLKLVDTIVDEPFFP